MTTRRIFTTHFVHSFLREIVLLKNLLDGCIGILDREQKKRVESRARQKEKKSEEMLFGCG